MTKKGKVTDEEREKLAAKLDKDLDDFIVGLEQRSYTEGWPEDKWQEEFEKHPFFMTKSPEPGQEIHPLLEGIQQIKYDSADNTKEELAAAYKDDGNFNFKYKKYRLAILSYTEGIRQRCSQPELNAQLFNNRAASHFFLNNYRSSLNDCLCAIRLKGDYTKALIRAAECCQKLGKYDECITFCNQLLKSNPADGAALAIRTKATAQRSVVERDKRRELVKQKKEKLDGDKVLQSIKERGIRLLNNDLSAVKCKFTEVVKQSVHLHDGRLIWPVMVLYPEFQTTDFIQEFHEDTTFADHLKEMFSESPDWDHDGKYRPDNIAVYFEDLDGVPHAVKLADTLGQTLCLKSFFIDSGTPAFIILAKKSKTHQQYLKKN